MGPVLRWKERPTMGNAADIATVVATVISLLTGEVALVLLVFKYGQKSGAEQVRQEAERQARARAYDEVKGLKTEIADLKAQLSALPPKRWRKRYV
jgi:hypothetical protein